MPHATSWFPPLPGDQPNERPCAPCADGEHADDGMGAPCPCCGATVKGA